ncbi:NTP transferase domain-containing protein [Halostella sp. JP-L12]|uniref:NTP transferase domain-containing protein n=1 Tax=Halostella TaxID=1843185 RepID=UPI000EF830D7|nr:MULTISPECIES: NTP transferase domain-containing protein [Halostella]NHN47953.1 NTP transferase domain-containing protein [Halostella sp. JP-L12]
MCGGKGTRLDAAVEKPLFEVGGRPMVDRVADALDESAVDTTYAVTSPHAPETAAHVRDDLDLPTIETPGDGYVADLDAALSADAVEPPVLTVAADLPLLAGDAVDAVLRAHEGGSLTVCVPAALKDLLGASHDAAVDGLAPTGINVVDHSDSDTMHTTHDARLAVNVNRRSDAEVAEALL